METPEPIVNRVHLHARGAASALLRRNEAFGNNQRHGRLERARQLLAEESLRHDDAIGPAEPLKNQIAQTGADRYADHQRAGEHGHRDGDTGDDGEIRAPVMTKAAAPEVLAFIAGYATRCSFRSTRS